MQNLQSKKINHALNLMQVIYTNFKRDNWQINLIKISEYKDANDENKRLITFKSKNNSVRLWFNKDKIEESFLEEFIANNSLQDYSLVNLTAWIIEAEQDIQYNKKSIPTYD